MIYYKAGIREVVGHLRSSRDNGLSQSEVEKRLEQYGPNKLPARPPIPAWRRLLAQFQDILTILLLAATAVSFTAWLLEPGHALPYETMAIIAIVLLNAILGYVQESRAEQAVAALQAMAASQARVIRDGRNSLIPAGELVPGDILQIEEGDSIPADGRVIESIAMRVAEAALTGESTPVTKDTGALVEEAGPSDQENMVFNGTVVVSGRGRAIVTATGAATEIGLVRPLVEIRD